MCDEVPTDGVTWFDGELLDELGLGSLSRSSSDEMLDLLHLILAERVGQRLIVDLDASTQDDYYNLLFDSNGIGVLDLLHARNPVEFHRTIKKEWEAVVRAVRRNLRGVLVFDRAIEALKSELRSLIDDRPADAPELGRNVAS